MRHAVEHLLERTHRRAHAVLLDQRDEAVGDPGAARQLALREAMHLAHVFETRSDVDAHRSMLMIVRIMIPRNFRSRPWPPNPHIQHPTSTPTGCRSRRTASSRPSRACWRSASGMYYETPDGRKILDGVAGLWCVNAGHGRQEITRGGRAAARGHGLRAAVPDGPSAARSSSPMRWCRSRPQGSTTCSSRTPARSPSTPRSRSRWPTTA